MQVQLAQLDRIPGFCRIYRIPLRPKSRSSCLHPVILSKNLQLLNICKANLSIFVEILAIILDFLLKLYYAAKCSRNEHSASGPAPAFLLSLNAALPTQKPLTTPYQRVAAAVERKGANFSPSKSVARLKYKSGMSLLAALISLFILILDFIVSYLNNSNQGFEIWQKLQSLVLAMLA
jgi:hypothetical protein